MKTLFVLAIAAAAALGLTAASEPDNLDGAPGRCLLQVDGKTYVKGRCNISMLDKEGSFCIGCGSRDVSSKHFAYVLRSDGNPTNGSWNGPEMFRKADSPLGDLRRDGACWVNARAKICAWR